MHTQSSQTLKTAVSAALILATLVLAGCGGSKKTRAGYWLAIENATSDDFDKVLISSEHFGMETDEVPYGTTTDYTSSIYAVPDDMNVTWMIPGRQPRTELVLIRSALPLDFYGRITLTIEDGRVTVSGEPVDD